MVGPARLIVALEKKIILVNVYVNDALISITSVHACL